MAPNLSLFVVVLEKAITFSVKMYIYNGFIVILKLIKI